jgi:hypothetical protein
MARVVITHQTITIPRSLEPWCPTCGASEDHPHRTDRVLIRGFKVDEWSQCLVCSGYYDSDLNEQQHKHDPDKGWFC